MFGYNSVTPEQLFQRRIDDIDSAITDGQALVADLRRRTDEALETIARHERDKADYGRALKRLTGGKSDAGTITAHLRLDTAVFDKQVADAKATLEKLREG